MTMSRLIGSVLIAQAIRERENRRSESMSGLAENATVLRIHWKAVDLMTLVRVGRSGRNTGIDMLDIR